MKKNLFTTGVALALVACFGLSSCIGSFNLSNKVLNWNKGLTDSKLVNEVVFLALNIIPVYSITMAADALIFNTIEFWTDSNPIVAGTVKTVEGANGTYIVETTENGYNITQGNETVSLTYDKESNVWSAVVGNETVKLVKIEGEKAIVFLPDGTTTTVELTQAGVTAFRQSIENSMYFATR